MRRGPKAVPMRLRLQDVPSVGMPDAENYVCQGSLTTSGLETLFRRVAAVQADQKRRTKCLFVKGKPVVGIRELERVIGAAIILGSNFDFPNLATLATTHQFCPLFRRRGNKVKRNDESISRRERLFGGIE